MAKQNFLSPEELRHNLHQNPELSLQEFQTTKTLIDNIKKMSSHYELPIDILTPLQTGLIVKYQGTDSESPYTLFRADIDALPIVEKNDCPFKSNNQNMHACGHDVHTSILYGFLEETFKYKYQKNILFLFQPAEEDIGGAKLILDAKTLDQYNISEAYALHVTDEYQEGTVATKKGPLFASAMAIDISFTGQNSHIAFPHKGHNAFKALRLFLDTFDKIEQDPTDPFIFNFGKIEAGEVRNVLPSHALLQGGIRAVSVQKTNELKQLTLSILEYVSKITKVKTNLNIVSHYDPVINNKLLYEKHISNLNNHFDLISCELKMTGEDFGFISNKYPSLMFWLGTNKNDDPKGLHHPEFLPDDTTIQNGINLFKEVILNNS